MWKTYAEKGIRHYLRDCIECPKKEKDRLFENLRQRSGKSIMRASENMEEGNAERIMNDAAGITVNATFGDKMITEICTDIGADANLLDSKILSDMERFGVEFNVEKFATRS